MRNAGAARERLEGRRNSGSLSVVTAFLFFVMVASSTFIHMDMALAFAAYVLLSMFTFAIYAVDKSSARKGTRRISESTLHLLSLTGGWPGALVAQQVLRHKTRKQPFRFVFSITVILNCCVSVWLFTSTGTSALRMISTTIRDLVVK